MIELPIQKIISIHRIIQHTYRICTRAWIFSTRIIFNNRVNVLHLLIGHLPTPFYSLSNNKTLLSYLVVLHMKPLRMIVIIPNYHSKPRLYIPLSSCLFMK